MKGPKGAATRPTADRVREAAFDMLESLLAGAAVDDEGDRWAGRRVLDLYAGTGALGIEALSRGANEADFVESSVTACQVIRENLVRTKLAEGARVHCQRAEQFLRRQGSSVGSRYDVVLMDPPYADPGIEGVLAMVGGLIGTGGWLVVEHAHRRPLPDTVGGLAAIRTRRHGDTDVTIYVPQS